MDNTTPAFHPLDHLSVVRRRLWWLITPVVLAAIVGVALAMWLPRIYETHATLGVSIPSMSQQLVTNSDPVAPEERLRKSREAFMGALPEQTQANVALLTGMQQQLESTTNAVRGEQDRLSFIERQIDAMKGNVVTDISVPGASPSTPASQLRVMQI